MNTNLLRTITPEEVDTYHRDGVLLLQNMFDKDWIELLDKGLDVNIKTPTRRSRIWHKDTSGHSMFYDHTAWQGIDEYRNRGHCINPTMCVISVPYRISH